LTSTAGAADFTPQWVKSAIWYQIFPERFANGDPTNDPTAASVLDAASGGDNWQVHSWTADWYELQPYEKQTGSDLWFNLPRRRYGGDIAGVIQRLNYLQNLGVTALYLNPVFESPSHHKYDGATFHHVDPHFGPDPDGDRALIAGESPEDPQTWVWTSADKLLLELIRKTHERGMRIICDGVFNHVGLSHWAFRDVLERQQHSRFHDWFKVKSWDNAASGDKFDYEAWRGHRSLPELRQENDHLAPGPRAYIYAITRRWMAPQGVVADGIDGWRLDVAPWLPHGFWKDWRGLVKSINPQAYIVAEIIRDVDFNKPYLQGDEFDAVMNYNFAFACDEYFAREKTRIKTSEFDRLLSELRDAYPACVAPAMQNLIDSHDTARFASHIVNRDRLDYRRFDDCYHPRQSRAENPAFDTRKPNAQERRIQKLFVLFQMTYLGSPMIYYGDEAGMWGGNDPCCRKPMLWHDLQYANEAVQPDGSRRALADKVEFDWDLFHHYRLLISLRRTLPALCEGDYRTLLADDESEVLAFARRSATQEVIVVVNRSRTAQSVSLGGIEAGNWLDMLNGNGVYSSIDGLTLEIAELWGAVLLRQDDARSAPDD
jgi:cyclomaltodextrinase